MLTLGSVPSRRVRCPGTDEGRRSMKIVLVLLVVLCSACTHPFAVAPRPNIVLILADDLGFSDVSPYGGEIHTPNLQRLADEGLRFTQFYDNAKCTVTRASLLSGMYPRNHGDSIPLEFPTIAEMLRAHGYQTGMSGKWHLGASAPQRPIDRGFDEFYGLMGGAMSYFDPARPDPEFKSSRIRTFVHNDQPIREFPPDFYATDAFAAHTVETIRRFAKAETPFFIHLAFTAPHYPLHARPEDIARYRGRYTLGWDELRRQRHARQLALGLLDPSWTLSPTDARSYAWESANQEWEDLRMATYAAMVESMDRGIGRVLEALDALGIADDTLVIFLSDNGGTREEPGGRDDTQLPGLATTYTAVGPAWGSAQNTPFRRYKSWVDEGGISTPFIARWPGHIVADTQTQQIGHVIDVLPTLLELTGAKTTPLEGRSLAQVLRGETLDLHTDLFWQWSRNRAIRRGKWKLVWDGDSDPLKWRLYDMELDRTELDDLAERHPEIVKELAESHSRWAKATGRSK